jgi:hypothetical protein
MTTLEAQMNERAKWDDFTREGMALFRRTRNHERKMYTLEYLAHLTNGRRAPDGSAFDLGYMAMQAVRLELAALKKSIETKKEITE